MRYVLCRNPRCSDDEYVKFGLCASCRLAGAWGGGLAFVMAGALKLAGLLFLVVFLVGCGKDNPVGPSHRCAHFHDGEWHEYDCHADPHHHHHDRTAR